MSIIGRLPKDTMICTTEREHQVRIGISMTLESADHARALVEAINMALIPLLEMSESKQANELPLAKK